MKIAYAILAHSSRQHVLEQICYFYHPEAEFYYHVDEKSAKELHALVDTLVTKLPNVHTTKPSLCSWGGFTLVEAMFRLISQAFRTSTQWTHLAFLSELHLPCKSYDQLISLLEPGVSVFQHTRYGDLNQIALDDVNNRFSFVYREVPGVGMFPEKPSEPVPDNIKQDITHGSQWIILDRSSCGYLLEEVHRNGWGIFAKSLFADETAIQSVILKNHSRIRVKNQPATYIAKTHDMVFDEAGFQEAVLSDYFFIRKRPLNLAKSTQEYLERNIAPKRYLLAEEFIAQEVSAESTSTYIERLILEKINSLLPPGFLFVDMPPLVLRPKFYAKLQMENESEWRIYLLSSDLCNFKIVPVVRPLPSKGFALSKYGEFETNVTRVRAHDLAYHREILIQHVDSKGFVLVGDISEIEHIASGVMDYVRILSGKA